MINIKFQTTTYYPYYLKGEDGTRYMMLSASKGLYLKKNSMSFFEISNMQQDDREYLSESTHISYNEWAENAQNFIRKFFDINNNDHFKWYIFSPIEVHKHSKRLQIDWLYLLISNPHDFIQGATLIGERELSRIEEILQRFAKYTAFPKRHNLTEYSL